MTINESPDRTITIDGEEYLYFGGTNFLGITTNTDFQNILFESIKKWGTGYGSSRNANIKLSIYEKAEKLLAKNCGTETAVTVSSGMLAGKLVLEHLSKTTDAIFHFPNVHPALSNSLSSPLIEDGKLNSKIFEDTISKITILTDAIPSQTVLPIDLSILNTIPKEKEVNLVIDESNSIGIIGNEWLNILNREKINIIKTASLGKALGISGGVIAGNQSFICEIRNLPDFIGASGMNPAFLETYCNSQEIYHLQKQKLLQNLNYINAHFKNRESFIFHAFYPVIYFQDESILEKLIKDKIIATSFKYTNVLGKLNRIVITANHKTCDLIRLLVYLNS